MEKVYLLHGSMVCACCGHALHYQMKDITWPELIRLGVVRVACLNSACEEAGKHYRAELPSIKVTPV